MNPDDMADYREGCLKLSLMINNLGLNDDFSDDVIGSTFYKIAAMKAIKTGLSLRDFLEIGGNFYLKIEQMVEESDNGILND